MQQDITNSDQTFDVTRCVSGTVLKVFETMLSLKAKPAPDQTIPHHPNRVTGSVGLGGESVTGAAYIHMSETVAAHAASAMLSMPIEELSEGEINDVVGDMCNMLCGGLKSSLCDAGFPCAISMSYAFSFTAMSAARTFPCP